MRLSPPITILAIVALALGTVGIVSDDGDCAYTPDGKPRFSNPFTLIWDKLTNRAHCDVWSNITAKKPIETIELHDQSKGGSWLHAEISPDGSGFVAVVPPFDFDHPLNHIDDPTSADYAKYGAVFQFRPNRALYAGVVQNVGPVRDFQGGWLLSRDVSKIQEDGWLLTGSQQDIRKISEVDDPRTRLIKCRKTSDVIPEFHGPLVTFKFSNPPSIKAVDTGANCMDTAQEQFSTRVKEAIEAMVHATGKEHQIDELHNRRYPFCNSPDDVSPCRIMLL